MPGFLPVLPKVPQTHRFQSPWPRRSRIFRTFPGLPDVLVTGASGAIGSDLAPRLLRAGHRVRGFARDPARVTVPGLEGVVRGDAVTGDGLDEALAGVDVAYYLIHSMEASAGRGFDALERASVEHFVNAAREAGVRRAVYLGGPVPAGARASVHLSSRLVVEEALLAGFEEAVALRASIIVGARSRSFRFLVRLVERLPALPLPPWRSYRTAPIDERDVVAMLVAAASSEHAQGGLSLDIAGPDVLSYGEIIETIADLMLVGRIPLRLGFSAGQAASRVAAAIAGEDHALIGPLMEGLTSDLLPRDDRAAQILGVRLHRFEAAVEHALREWEESEPLAAR
jgi:uncharacterized protein YbjT (DUF2867 family)